MVDVTADVLVENYQFDTAQGPVSFDIMRKPYDPDGRPAQYYFIDKTGGKSQIFQDLATLKQYLHERAGRPGVGT